MPPQTQLLVIQNLPPYVPSPQPCGRASRFEVGCGVAPEDNFVREPPSAVRA